jgi:hypothetical protein
VVINLVEYVTNGVMLKADWASAMQALGKSPEISGRMIAVFNVWGFLAGIVAVWIYAAIRPRYGAGPMTAARAGLVTWVLLIFLGNLTLSSLGIFPTRMLVIAGSVELVEMVIATIVGASIYKEEQASAVRSAAA